jgi:hypothetical protein
VSTGERSTEERSAEAGSTDGLRAGAGSAVARSAEAANEAVAVPSATERPSFAKEWPRDAELDRLLTAFEGGNYALVKRDAPLLAERATDELVRRAAEELLKRTQPDPLSSLLILVASGLLAFFAYWYYTHGHGR